MEDPIDIDFDDDGEAVVKKSHKEQAECFGMVICPHCVIKIETVTLENGKELASHRPFCNHVKKDAVEIFAESENAKCPLGYWARARILRSI